MYIIPQLIITVSNRNLLLTKTAMGCYVSLAATFIAVSPSIESLLSRGKTDTEKANTRDLIAIAIGIIGGAGTLTGRYKVGDVYTPALIPGRDKIPPLPPLQ